MPKPYLGRHINSNTRVPFRDNAGLRKLTIGKDVTAINTNAFYGCNGVTELHSLNPTPPTAPNNCFYNMYATCKLFVPAGSEGLYKAATEWSKFF